jgi:hypothetical protein
MKPLRHIFLATTTAAVIVLSLGCATTQTSTQNRESMLVAAGFKVITPKTAAQQQKLQNLPPGKITRIQKKGKTYYIFPEPAKNLAYVGGPKQYQEYQQLRVENRLAQEDVESAEMYQDTAMEWSVWGGGEGVWGPMGGPEPF